MSEALVILSGGQDSTTCLFWALEKFQKVHAITFNYGQKHIIELEAANKVVRLATERYPSKMGSHEFVTLPKGLLQSTSPLLDPTQELEHYESAEQMEEVIGERRELTFVPMRNALFLTIAANRAEAMGVKNLVTGVCQMDNANYDDCRETFIFATQDYINKALGHDHRGTDSIVIQTPLMHLTKAETVHLAHSMEHAWAALAYTHTCYAGIFPPTDPNHANVLRAEGFEKADLPDPLVLRAVRLGVMEMPTTKNYRYEPGFKG